MSNLKAKLKKQGGFTMVELLIVVAIIGILAAVSIPLFNNALEKARHGVDAANIRSAVSMANAEVAVSANPAEDFKDAKIYDYIVDSDHQAELVEGTKDGTVTNGAKLQCSDVSSASTLKVSIVYDAAATGTNLIDKIKVETNWKLNDAKTHYEVDTSFGS